MQTQPTFDLERELNALQRSIPGLRNRHPFDIDFWKAFNAKVAEIERRVPEAEIGKVQMRLVLMLGETLDGESRSRTADAA